MKEKFDFESFSKTAIEKLKEGKPLTGNDGVFTPLLKMILEASLESEITNHIQDTKTSKNRRNGAIKKQIKSGLGRFELETPRDRNRYHSNHKQFPNAKLPSVVILTKRFWVYMV